MSQLQDRIAIVTGGAQGLGAAVCHRLAREGATVVVADIRLSGAEDVARAIVAETERPALALPVDVTDETQVREMVERTVAECGRLDILVANAGILYATRLGIGEAEVRQRYIDQVPMKRGCTYEDVTNVVVFLASDHAGYMTGQAINVSGGQEMR